MPRDQWARANVRAKYGPTGSATTRAERRKTLKSSTGVTLKQKALLRKVGYTKRQVRLLDRNSASALIAEIARNNWQPLPWDLPLPGSIKSDVPENWLYDDDAGRYVVGWYGREPIYA